MSGGRCAVCAAVLIAMGIGCAPAPSQSGADGPDAGAPASDAGVQGSDAGVPVAAGGDGGSSAQHDAGVVASPPCTPSQTATRLSELCLFEDTSTRRLRSDVVEFAPAHALWTDGAQKRRWIRLPAGTQIDSSDMDHWQFPVGTQVFKEFALEGKLLETRMIWRTGTGAADYVVATYIWTADQTDAIRNDSGATDVHNTAHDVPPQRQCGECHDGEPGQVLGFSAVQLSHAASPNVKELAAGGLLSHPPAAGQEYSVPGTQVDVAALGYLHANCGHCHSPTGQAWREVDLDLRLRVSERAAASTQTYLTTVGVNTQDWSSQKSKRVAPGAPADSEIHYRMSLRNDRRQMPPLGTATQDQEGLQAVSSWILGL